MNRPLRKALARGAALAAAAVATLLAASPVAAAPQNSGQIADVPLEFDPAKPEKVEGWWFNGQDLLRLEANGAYRMWITPDRFASPVEVGAWRRSNYVLFDLEPYRARPGTRVRVQLVKVNGETCIQRDGMRPFKRSLGPPRVFGDEVLGAWTADREQLLVLDNGRYEYRRTGPAQGISRHDGTWCTVDRTLLLTPDSTVVAPVHLAAETESDGTTVLRGAGGVLRPVRPEPTPSQPAPATPTPATPVPAAPPPVPATPAPSAPATPAPATPASVPPTPASPAPAPTPPTVPPTPPSETPAPSAAPPTLPASQ